MRVVWTAWGRPAWIKEQSTRFGIYFRGLFRSMKERDWAPERGTCERTVPSASVPSFFIAIWTLWKMAGEKKELPTEYYLKIPLLTTTDRCPTCLTAAIGPPRQFPPHYILSMTIYSLEYPLASLGHLAPPQLLVHLFTGRTWDPENSLT